jgi:hypothetical protein
VGDEVALGSRSRELRRSRAAAHSASVANGSKMSSTQCRRAVSISSGIAMLDSVCEHYRGTRKAGPTPEAAPHAGASNVALLCKNVIETQPESGQHDELSLMCPAQYAAAPQAFSALKPVCLAAQVTPKGALITARDPDATAVRRACSHVSQGGVPVEYVKPSCCASLSASV